MKDKSPSYLFPFPIKVSLKAKKRPDPRYPVNLKTVGDHILKYRLDHKLSQASIANKLGVSNNTISNWENNRTHPRISYLPEIIKMLGYDLVNMEPENISEELIHHRRKNGLSQKRLADLIGIDEETIIRLEKGNSGNRGTFKKVEGYLKQYIDQ